MSILDRCRLLSETPIMAAATRTVLITGYIGRVVVLIVLTYVICSCTQGGIGEELAKQYHQRFIP